MKNAFTAICSHIVQIFYYRDQKYVCQVTECVLKKALLGDNISLLA
jgi:hypothetical protein